MQYLISYLLYLRVFIFALFFIYNNIVFFYNRQFSMFPYIKLDTNISNWLGWILNSIQYSYTEILFRRLYFILSPLLYKCYLVVVKPYHDIFYSGPYFIFTNILGCSFCQLQTSFASVNFVNFSLLVIPSRIRSSSYVPCVLGILTIISHTNSRLTIQYN